MIYWTTSFVSQFYTVRKYMTGIAVIKQKLVDFFQIFIYLYTPLVAVQKLFKRVNVYLDWYSLQSRYAPQISLAAFWVSGKERSGMEPNLANKTGDWTQWLVFPLKIRAYLWSGGWLCACPHTAPNSHEPRGIFCAQRISLKQTVNNDRPTIIRKVITLTVSAGGTQVPWL